MARFNLPLFLCRFNACPVTAGGCRVWTGKSRCNGYGTYGATRGNDRRSRLAHRISYEVFVGPIPDGLCVLHNCPDGDNRLCVNPEHLWIGTKADNAKDRMLKGRNGDLSGENNGGAKLTKFRVEEIFLRYQAGGVTQRQLAVDYNVSDVTISHIVTGHNWSHVTEPLRRKVPSP